MKEKLVLGATSLIKKCWNCKNGKNQHDLVLVLTALCLPSCIAILFGGESEKKRDFRQEKVTLLLAEWLFDLSEEVIRKIALWKED